MKPLVSVIVPVYKVEDVLVRCLDSLCRQSLQDIEIILVDDASPDRCGEICDVYASKDTRFKVIHNEKNQGLSVARNIGIEHASCDYLMFVDSDDLVHEDFCKDAYECAVNNHSDLVMFRHQSITKPEQIQKNKCFVNSPMASGYKTKIEATELLLKEVTPSAWNKLYRKEVFYNISYPPGYLHEDIGTTYKTIWQASQIYYLNRTLYYHYHRIGSITTLKTEKRLRDFGNMAIQQYYGLLTNGYPVTKLNVLYITYAMHYCTRRKTNASDNYYAFFSDILLANKSVPVSLTWKWKIMIALFKHCRPLFNLICFLYIGIT